jgi:CRP-like cAMP-binding protein
MEPRLDISSHPVFAGVALSQSDMVRRLRRRLVEPGEIVSGPEGQPALVIVLSGRLHVHVLTIDGRRQILELLVPGDLDGMLAHARLGGHICEAESPSQVAILGFRQLDDLITAHPQMARNLYRAAVGRLLRREEHMAAMAERMGSRALARQLLSLNEYASLQCGGRKLLIPRPTHQLLADMLGLRRETVTLNLIQLRKAGAVSLYRDALEVHRSRMEAFLARPQRPERDEDRFAMEAG